MNTLLSYWIWDPASAVLLLLLTTGYVALHGFSFKERFIYFAAAFTLLVICFFSPLHLLSAHYLFSAHMTEHVLLLFFAGPLLLASLPPQSFRRFFTFLNRYPFICWICGIGIMWYWHIPVVFNNRMNAMHTASWSALTEPISLLLAGIIFSAPIIHPAPRQRIKALSGIIYLFTACTACTLLGILIAFAEPGTYHHFLSMHDTYGLNAMITGKWGITEGMDQQAAGLIMWVPCCLVYVSTAMYLLLHWLKVKEPSPYQYMNN